MKQLTFLLISVAFITFYSCEKELVHNNREEYLDFYRNINDGKLNHDNQKVLYEAYKRLPKYFIGMKIIKHDFNDLMISKRLYDYLCKSIASRNECMPDSHNSKISVSKIPSSNLKSDSTNNDSTATSAPK